jgi:hypothetical protein
MMTTRNTFTADMVIGPVPGETRDEFRSRVAQRQADALERRTIEVAGQTAHAHSATERIKIWERLHQIALPRDPAHRVLHVIAEETALSLEQVLEEQRQRKPSLTDRP